jgi:spore cortex biosynthesis protein YabQ
METYLSDQAVAFLWAVLLGGGLGAVYDVFRILRILRRRTPWLIVFGEDLLFALLAALSTAFCYTLTNHGQVRAFLLVGEGLGFLIWFYTIGAFIVWQARLIARLLAAIRRFLGRFFDRFKELLGKIMNFLKKPFLFCKGWYKMNVYRLKERRMLHAKKKDESHRAGPAGRRRGLRRRQYGSNLRQAPGADPGKKGRAE